jgi:hypothetical protein
VPIIRVGIKRRPGEYANDSFEIELSEADLPRKEGESIPEYLVRLQFMAHHETLRWEMLNGYTNKDQFQAKVSRLADRLGLNKPNAIVLNGEVSTSHESTGTIQQRDPTSDSPVGVEDAVQSDT